MMCRMSWLCLNDILIRFQGATGLFINKTKSSIPHSGTNTDIAIWIADLLGITLKPLQDGMKYLGFQMKANGYTNMDWSWLLERFSRKISVWENHALSLAGRYILTQVVLSQLAVYWAHLYALPVGIIKKVNRIIANFIWSGRFNSPKIHLLKLDRITVPKNRGGWGLLDISLFGQALLCKSLTRALFGEGLWSKVIRRVYLQDKDLIYWYRRGGFRVCHGSAIWLGFKRVQHFFFRRLTWRLNKGTRVFIGTDSIYGMQENFIIPDDLLSFFHRSGWFTWEKLIHSWQGPILIWKTAQDLNIPDPLRVYWTAITSSLRSLGIFQSGSQDSLVWVIPKKKVLARVCDIYCDMSCCSQPPILPIFPMKYWPLRCPLKMILFSWLVFNNQNLTRENLRRRCWQGPSCCCMCEEAEESNLHMFFRCHATRQIWYDLSIHFGFTHNGFDSVQDAYLWWGTQDDTLRTLFIIAIWFFWR